MAGLLCLLASGWLAWNFGGSLSWWFGWTENYWLGPVLVFLASYLTINAILASVLSVLQLSGGGIWTASPVRWLVGKCAFLLLLAPTLWIVGLLLPVFGLNWQAILRLALYPVSGLMAGAPPLDPKAFWLSVVIVGITGWTIISGPRELKPFAAYLTRPLRNLWRAMKTGVGGSASFMGLFDEWESAMQWKPGRVLLGTSLYEPGQRLGKWDDRHIITIATTRSGKGRSCIIPNLLTWPGSALVIDPKGENAAVTARARRQLGQKVHIVDPFRLLERLGLDADEFPRHRLNPLKEIALDDPEAVDQIRNLSAALVMIPAQGNTFWDESAMNILDGIIAHVMSSPLIADNERHLGTVRDYVTQTNKRKMSDLRESETVGGLAEKGYAFYKGASESASGDILTTLNVHMKWIDSPAMQNAMMESDFSFAELKHGDSTVYLVIPPEYLDTHSRYLRLFITLALKAAGRGRKAQHAMLFIMDEFAALGALQVVATAAGVASGSGVKLWPIIQNLTQLQVYGDSWDVFLANAGQRQIFAMNDRSTADYFSKELGDHIAWRKVRGPGGMEWAPYSATWLRTGPELARESSRDSEKAVILFEGGEAALVRRAGYDRLFTTKEYDPNPYQPPPWRPLASAMQELRDARDTVTQGGFERLIKSRVGPRIVALLGDSVSAKAMTEARAIYNAPTEAAQCAAFNRAADALHRAVKDGNAAEIRAWQFVFVEYEALLEGKEPRNESERRNLQMAGKLAACTFDGEGGGTQAAAALPAPSLPPDQVRGSEGKPDPSPDSVAAPQEPAGEGEWPDLPDAAIEAAPLPPLPKPLKAPPLKKPRKPRAKKTP